MESCLDFMSAVLDEISLEGLDGITVPTLWVRLENRPNFPLAIDENTKSYLWKCVAVREELEIFELPESRPTFVLFNRYKYIDEELGIVVEPDKAPPDLYPIHEVEDGDIRGSCASYYTRKCITSQLRRDGVLLLSLQEAMEKWSEKLVLVASPLWRRLALLGSEVNPLSEMALDVYCLLERIGRSRYCGEVTQGSSGLLSLKEDYAKKMHYLRTKLTRRGLITKQLHYSRNKNGVTVKGSLFHLTRFYVQRKCKMQSLVKCICDILKNKPRHRELCRTLRMELNVKEGTFKKLFYKPLQNWFKISSISHREMYPEASDKECVTCHGQERMLKVVTLIRSYEEEEEEEENECEDDGESTIPQNNHFDPYRILFDKTLISQAYNIVYVAGPEGITAQEMRETMSLPRLQIRGLCKTLLKFKVVMTLMQDRGRQRVTRFISKEFEEQSATFIKVKEQHQKFLDLPVGAFKLSESIDAESSCVSLQSNGGSVPSDTNPGSVNDAAKQSNFQNIESEVIEVDKVQISKTETKDFPSFGEALKSCEVGMVSKRNISLRLLERANKILETMQSVKVALFHELKNTIVEHEAKEGLVWKMDKKSNLRLLNRLVCEGHLKYVKINLRLEDTKKQLDFVCHPSVSANDPLMKAAIEQAKFKYFGVSKTSQGKAEKAIKGEAAKEAMALRKGTNNLLTDKNVKCSPMEYAPSVGRTVYGLQSKFVRSKYLHLFLFYLLHDYQGVGEKHDEPFVHHNSDTWKRFIPPPPVYPAAGEGWCILSDIMLCMPLSIFLKIVNIRYRIFGLNEYLDDPVKCNYLIKHLPQELRNALLCGGRYRWMIFDVVQRLCYMGLVSFGPQVRKDKDQIFFYLHKNASIKDTTVSPPGYIFIDSSVEYETKKYIFNVLDDVEAYWYDLENICLHTNLSRYSVAQGQNICTMDLNHKDEMIRVSRSVDFNEVVDDGSIPGDSLGAAGLDSALFAHMKRNWYFASSQNQLLKNGKHSELQSTKSALGKHLMKTLLQDDASKAHLQNKRHRQRLARNSFLSSVDTKKGAKRNLSKNGATETRKRRKIGNEGTDSCPGVQQHLKRVKIRTVRKTFKTKRKPYYDDKDKAAIKKMSKQRVDWTPQEDSFLLLCKVASLFLNPKMRCLVVPFFVVRDLLHERFPELSANKSSRACQRRVRYMLMNPITRVNVSVFLGEARQDTQLVKEYDIPKPPKTQEDEWRNMFSNVLKKLLVKFTASAASRCQKMDLPETLAEFQKMYEIKSTSAVFAKESSHHDPRNIKEIYLGVITSLVVSSFCTLGDKLNWSYTLYKLYKQYPEELMLTVVNRLRSDQLITKKRDYAKKMIPAGPMSSIPFRFSVTYANALATKYPVTMFEEAAEFLNKLNKVRDLHQSVMFDGNVCGGYCGAVLSLMSMNLLEFENTTRDQILFLDTSLSEDERKAFIKQLNLSESLEERVSTFLTLKGKQSQEDHEKEAIQRSAKRLKLGESDDSHTGVYSDVESSEQTNVSRYSVETDVSDVTVKTNRSTSSVDAPATKTASRIALYMLRQEYCLPPTEKAQHSQDYFVINSNPVYCKLMENYEHIYQCFVATPSKVIGSVNEMSEKCKNLNVSSQFSANLISKTVNTIITPYIQYIPENVFHEDASCSEKLHCIYQQYSEDVLLNAQQILDYISRSKEFGVTHVELWKKFRHVTDLSLCRHISLLQNNFLIFRIGVTCFCYVHARYVRPWIVSSFIIPKDMRSYATECMKRVAISEECSGDDSHPDLQNKRVMKCNESQSEHASEHSTSQVDSETEQCADGFHSEPADGENISGDKTGSDKSLSESEVVSEKTRLSRCASDSDTVVKPKNEESWEHVKFISRIWRKPDGSLNRPMIVKYMTSIIGYLKSYPGSSERNICERFSYVLQPVQTLELLEMLEKMECVCKFYAKKCSKTTLFSAPSDSFIVTNPEPDSVVHYETAVDAMIKMGKIKEALVLKH